MAVAKSLAELFGRRRFAMRPGTGRITALLDRLGHPERSFRTIHVVGTNGKGSTAAFLSTILTTAGYRTGLFTSPHLISYTERFRVDGIDIPAEQLDRLLTKIFAVAGPDDTFFELTTALACCWFAERSVQLAVLEAGMGGKADATAAISAMATVISPISLDHQQWLGGDLPTIAREKAAIAETGCPIICAPQAPDALAAITRHCHQLGNRLLLAGEAFEADWQVDGTMTYNGIHHHLDTLRPGIPGRYQLWNAAGALAAAELISAAGLPVSAEAMADGIANARWSGRMERFSLTGGVELLLDGAHNPAGATALAESLRHEQPDRRIVLVLGVMADKDLTGILRSLLPLADQVITVAPDQERAVSPTELAAQCAALGSVAAPAGTVGQGLTIAQRHVQPGDLIVVAGSLFTVGEAKAFLTGQTSTAVRG